MTRVCAPCRFMDIFYITPTRPSSATNIISPAHVVIEESRRGVCVYYVVVSTE